MKARWQVFLGALVLVPAGAAVAFPEADTGGVVLAGVVLVVLVAVLAFGVWADYVRYFGGATTAGEASESAGEQEPSERDDGDERCPECGAAVPAAGVRCEDCATVGSWRK